MEIRPFLTSYDPSDLPSASIDPLGFERGYLLLAEKMLPGLTNVANRPRYFSLLCLGASLAPDSGDLSPVKLKRNRENTILGLERLWTLGCVLASRKAGASYDPQAASGPVPATPPLELWGLRGITYSASKADELSQKNAPRTDGNYKLLLHQARYGVLGIYGVVADSLRLWDRTQAELTHDLGHRLAEVFKKETSFPTEIARTVLEDHSVMVTTLASWGARAHLDGTIGVNEAECFHEALHSNSVRSRMAVLLESHPFKDRDDELSRLRRIRSSIESASPDQDLAETIDMILAYENFYGLALLGFERLLWLCRTLPGGGASLNDVKKDSVLIGLRNQISTAVKKMFYSLEQGETEHFRRDIGRLDDAMQFARKLSESVSDSVEMVFTLMARHTDVQHGKFDQGRRKSPWVELASDHIALTMGRVGGLNREAISPDQIARHPYRLGAADALIRAARKQ